MKKPMYLVLGLGLLLSGTQSFAQNVINARNSFLTIPIFDSYQIGATVETAATQDLKKLCVEYHGILEVYKDMPRDSVKKIFVSRRESSGAWQEFLDTTFKVDFVIQASVLRDLLRGVDKQPLRNAAAQLRVNESLPLSVQVPMSLEVSNIQSSTASVSVQPRSLSQAARGFGLDYAGVRVERAGSQFLVSVYGADLACDLIEDNAKLILNSKALVRPEVSAQDQIGQFYFDFGQKISSELRTTKSNRKRIASLGFHAGRLLAEAGIDDREKQNAFIENLMEFLFSDDSLTLSAIWSAGSDREYFVNVQKMTEAQIKLELNIK